MKNQNVLQINLISRLARQGGLWLIPLTFAVVSLTLSPNAQAICTEYCSLGNTVDGHNAFLLGSNSAIGNTAIGESALHSNTTGIYNTATGFFALQNNTTGYDNTAIGRFALRSNTIGYENTSIGEGALDSNTTGIYNMATGSNALAGNTTGQ